MRRLLLGCVGVSVCCCALARQPEPPKVIITEKDADKTIRIAPGQRVEVHLRGERARTGWEENTDPRQKVLQALKPELLRDPRGADAAVGTYVFPYQALKEGAVALRFSYVYPGGPEVANRKATQLVATFEVIVEVRPPDAR